MNIVSWSQPLIAFVGAAVCALCVAACAETIADDFVAGGQPNDQSCVLLKNDNVLYGTAVQQGEWVIIRRDGGTELKLPGDQIACWANSIHDLYRYRVDHRSNLGPGSRIADIRWCLNHRLFHCASREIQSARQLLAVRPNSTLARQLDSLEKRLISLMTVDTKIRTVSHQTTANTDSLDQSGSQPDASRRTVNQGSLRDFTATVQPILLNRCGSCHEQPNESEFQLSMPIAGVRATRRITQRNIQAVIPMINTANPNKSQLLAKAITPHGGGPAGLGPHDMQAINAIKKWLGETTIIHSDSAGTEPSFEDDDRSRGGQPAPSVQTASCNHGG